MRWRRRDVVISKNCRDATFSLTRNNGVERVEGVDSFKYLGQLLHQLDNDWKTVLNSIWKVKQVWGHLGKLLWREVVDPIVSEKFYHTLV